MSYEVTAEEIPALVASMRNGDLYSRRKLIEAHVGLAFDIASDYRDDEALSEALVALVEATETFSKTDLPASAFVGYMQQALTWACLKAIRRPGNRGAIRTRTVDEATACELLSRKSHRLRKDTAYRKIDQMDLLLTVCESITEQYAVILKSKNYSGSETAKKLNISEGQLSKLMTKLDLRLQVQEKLLEERRA